MRTSAFHAALLPLFCMLPNGIAGAQTPPASVQLSIDYSWEAGRNLTGGLRTGAFQLGNLDLQAVVDASGLGKPFAGTTLFLYGLGNHGSDPISFTGDAQVFTNIAAPRALRLYEAWVERPFGDGNTSLLLGLYDLNSEFDAVQSAGLFLNSSFGIGVDFSQTGENGPSIFPSTSLAVRFRSALTRNVYAQIAALDGVPGNPDHPTHTDISLSSEDGALIAAEIGYVRGENGVAISRMSDAAYSFRASAGIWGYTATSDALLSSALRRNRGLYAALDAVLLPEREDPGQGLAVFARVGAADASVNRFGLFTGAGLVYTGPLPGRDGDQIGLAAASAHNSGDFISLARSEGQSVDASETSTELTYFAQLLSWMSLQLDTQYIVNPDTDPTLKNALTASMRWVISLRPPL